MNGMVAPGTSYTTYKSWLGEQGRLPIETPKGDIITFFDNMVKYIVKHYQITCTKNRETADITTATTTFFMPW